MKLFYKALKAEKNSDTAKSELNNTRITRVSKRQTTKKETF